jgi:threonine dehydrogenase-like Zn-dependent dehydrogenase
MKSRYVCFEKKGVVEVKTEDVSLEGLAPWEVVVRNEASLVSAGTELANLNNLEGNTVYPGRTGYASIGRLLAVGDAVKDFKPGDRVFYAGNHTEVSRFLHGQDHQWGRLYPVPEELAPVDAVFGCLAEIAMIAPVLSGSDLNDTVAVFGLGVIGNLCGQIYMNMGARVIALDPVVQRCELAVKSGIGEVLSVPVGQQVSEIKRLTGGAGAQICVDAAGHSAVISACVAAVAMRGQVIILGAPRVPVQGNLTEVFHDVFKRGIVVRGGHMWQLPAYDLRGSKKTVAWGYRVMFEWIRSGKLKVSHLRSHVSKLADAPGLYRGLQENKDKYWGVVFEY